MVVGAAVVVVVGAAVVVVAGAAVVPVRNQLVFMGRNLTCSSCYYKVIIPCNPCEQYF